MRGDQRTTPSFHRVDQGDGTQVPFPTEPFRLPFFFLLESKARFSNTLGKCSTIELCVCTFCFEAGSH